MSYWPFRLHCEPCGRKRPSDSVTTLEAKPLLRICEAEWRGRHPGVDLNRVSPADCIHLPETLAGA